MNKKDKNKEEEDLLSKKDGQKVDNLSKMASNLEEKNEKKNNIEKGGGAGGFGGGVSSGQSEATATTSEKNNGHQKKKKKRKRQVDNDDVDEAAAAATRFGSGIRVIQVKERHGEFRKAVPAMPLPLAIVLCLVNCLLPGIGTLISGFTVFCGSKTEIETRSKAFWLNVGAAILQIITLPILVGWIWSIIWGVTFITSSLGTTEAVKDDDDSENAQQV